MLHHYDKIPPDVRKRIPDPFTLVIDPSSDLFKRVAPLCDPTNPCKCLVAVVGYSLSGRRMSLTFCRDETDSETSEGILRISLGGGWSAIRQLPFGSALVRVGDRFDHGVKIRERASERVDPNDGSWTFEYRTPSKGRKAPREQKPDTPEKRIRHLRARHLREVRAEVAPPVPQLKLISPRASAS